MDSYEKDKEKAENGEEETHNIRIILKSQETKNLEHVTNTLVEQAKSKGYEVRGNCLILSMHEMTSEIKKELKNFFFVSASKDDSPYLYKQFYNLKEDKDIKKPKSKNLLKEDDKALRL